MMFLVAAKFRLLNIALVIFHHRWSFNYILHIFAVCRIVIKAGSRVEGLLRFIADCTFYVTLLLIDVTAQF